MRILVAVLSSTLVCAGCVQAPPPSAQAVISQATERVAADDPACREYTAQATVDGRPQQLVGRACQQSDGSWRIAEGPPDQPMQFQTVYAPVSYPYGYPLYYPYYDPWFLGPPIGLSFGGGFVFVDRSHHFHHFHHFGHSFANDGFRHDGFRHSGFGNGGFGGMHHG
ncbi:MAG: hypothetical protein J0H14_24130 [Alphaproteobacteria bacterium]|nr:hypothetical protein [Alphaproteobacteria bacterium]